MRLAYEVEFVIIIIIYIYIYIFPLQGIVYLSKTLIPAALSKSICTGIAICHMLANFTIFAQKPNFVRAANCKFFYNTATIPSYM